MGKRWISLLLTAAMVFGLCGPMGALVPEVHAAYTEKYTEGCFEYSLDTSGNAILTAILGCSEADIVIPDTLGGHPVTRIFALSSDCLGTIESITIPGGVQTIGDNAFDGFFNLKKVRIHDGVLEIGASAFEDCQMLTEVSLPSTLISIGDSAFSKSGLTHISLPSSITTWGDFIFSRCESLKEVELPANLKNVPDSMFSNCSGLTDITLPEGLQTIGSSAFSDTGLVRVDIPDTVTKMGSHAFFSCDNLETVDLPEKLQEIPDYAFARCSSLQKIEIPSGVTRIGEYAFRQCSQLKSAVIPQSVVQVGDEPFALCDNLADVYYGGTEEAWNDLMRHDISYGSNSPFRPTNADKLTMHFNAEGEGQDKPDTPPESAYIPAPVWNDARYTASGTVQLDWTIPLSTINQKVTMDGVKVLRKSGNGNFSVVGTAKGNVTFGYSDTAAKYGETYTYALQGFWQDQVGPISEERVVVCLGLEDRYDIPTPELTAGRNEPNGIRIEWKLPEKLPAGIEEVTAGFNILRKTENGAYTKIRTIEDPEADAFLDQTTTDGVTYTYTVQMFIEDKTGGMDSTGRTVTRKAVSENYPNDEIGWSVYNTMSNFGKDADYCIPKERFDEALGTKWSQQAFNAIKSVLKAGGYCYGLSVLAVAEYEGLVDLSSFFPDAVYTDKLSNFGLNAIEKTQDGKYKAVISDQKVIELIERAHVLQYAKEFQDCEVFAGQKDYHGLIEYLKKDSSKPLIVGMSTSTSGHAVASYPNMPPEDLGNGWYKVYLYDPNVPQIGYKSQLYTLGMNGELSSAYSGGQSYLLLNTNDTGVYGGIWQYYNPAVSPNALMESLYYMPQQSLMFYDLTKLPEHALDRTGAVQLRNFMVVRAKAPTVRAASASGSTTLLSVKPDSSAQGFSFTVDDKLVEHYSIIGEEGDTVLLWLKEDVGDVTLQGSDMEAMYIAEETAFDFSSTGKAEVKIDTANTSMSYQGDTDAQVELTARRNIHSEKDANSITISTELDADDSLTFTLREDGVPEVSGPVGQEYEVSYEKGSIGGGMSNMTAEEVQEFFGGEETTAFGDVPSNAYYADAVQWAVEQGITTGTSDRTFSPDEPCTRAQVVTFIWRTLGLDELSSRSTENPFRDVPSGAYYRDPVLWAAENGITTGTSATTFSPDDACTRAQVVTFLWRVDFPPKYYDAGQSFRDVRVSDYYWYPVQWAVERNITTGTSATTFSPNETCTRAQVVTFLYRDFAKKR